MVLRTAAGMRRIATSAIVTNFPRGSMARRLTPGRMTERGEL
jgi:hypothetical protein